MEIERGLPKHIPFTIDGWPGYLSVYGTGDLPNSFQVMLHDRRGLWYRGQFLYSNGFFWLERMDLQEHLEYFTALVMAWWM